MSGPTPVLIVEDEDAAAASIKFLLAEDPSFKFAARATGINQALAWGILNDPGVALVSLTLKRAADSSSSLRALSALGFACVVMLPSHAAADAEGYPFPALLKPFDRPTLLSALEAADASRIAAAAKAA